ncbi:TVP38/TMEM64 family protein [Paenibacillus sp. J2TS4]|uniref:TVP38/TMEM64 family protein n=1 Tax=Paenibacillus sp. J2TS4 TaxID=2807194 RepID=UPI001B2DDE5F|nr:TVP38/TMEM64 family protein [Paenibacillus sp. J2TS4]GIP31877.1 TVP38/TMEM64 family protein [Paenibacillus sp. J2TS4]
MIEWFERIYKFLSQLDMKQIQELLHDYSSLGPIPGIGLPAIEALLPFLPLFIIVAGNASAYGLWLGFLYSWIGTVIGACLIFLLARRFGGRFSRYIADKYPKADRFFSWIERKGFTPLFVMYCFPFTPSFFVNIAAGISTVPLRTYVASVLLGKSVMVFMMSFIGHDWQGLFYYPWRIVLVAAVLFILWYAGKRVEKRYQVR